MLIANWRQVLKRAWSVRLIALGILFQALEFVWPLLDGLLPIPQGAFAAIGFAISVASIVARLLSQKDFPNAGK